MDWKDSASIALPMIYDISSNITQLAERREPVQPVGLTSEASSILRRFAEFQNQGECSLFPAVRNLVVSLKMPNEPNVPSPQIQNQVKSI